MGVRRRAGMGLMLLAAGALLGGCTQEMVVGLTIVADPSVDEATLAALRRLDIRVTGVEGACVSYQLPEGFARSREERVIYRARARSGDLTFAVTVRDGSEGAKGYGTVRVTLEPNRVQFARVVVRSPVPAGADEPCILQPPDLGEIRDLPAPPGDQSQLNCDDGNPCTVDEVVQGSSGSLCRNTPGNRGTVCRIVAGACDVAETCDGASAACPGDVFTAAGTECRAANGACDVAESCDGSSAACPSDGFAASGTLCRAPGGPCDVVESCTGSSAACPPDGFMPPSIVCRPNNGPCDVAENCTGSSATCPVDDYLPSGTVCRGATSGCDTPETCDGRSTSCPADQACCMPSPYFWLRADMGVLLNGGRVSSWLDQSGGGRHANQADPARQPSFIGGVLNGQPVIRFGGSSQAMRLTSPITPTKFSFYIVGKNNNPSETYGLILGPASTPNNQLRWENGTQVLVVGTGNNLPAVTANVSIGGTRAYHSFVVDYDGQTLAMYRGDNILGVIRPVTTTGPWALDQVGAYFGSDFLQGDLAEIIVYDLSLPACQRESVLTYLAGKYGLPFPP